MKLVIVESPTKCKTIKRYLGDDYIVDASKGHIRDLATSGEGGLGVNIEDGFTPIYIISKDKVEKVKELKKLAKKADEVILATDPDREGEAIAWHLAKVLGLDIDTNKRWEFHEITKDAIIHALNNPRTIDKNLVASQESRRILDRIIGFRLSKLLKIKIHARSAGRVQSATLKLIYDRDKEIENFVPEEYYKLLVTVLVNNEEKNLVLSSLDGKKAERLSLKTSEEILSSLPNSLKVTNVKKTIKYSQPEKPFSTSTLQQEAFARLKFSLETTQRVSHKLYEGVEINGEHLGLITYMRTENDNLSSTFINIATDYINNHFGPEYVTHNKRISELVAEKTKNVGNDEHPHEAIRPTNINLTPASIRKYLTGEQYSLYKLIYNRTLASLMSNKKSEVTTFYFEHDNATFTLSYSKMLFNGYTIIYNYDEETSEVNIPSLKIGDDVTIIKKDKEQKFTQPPEHYTEGKIVKKMTEVGIGRPSTYVSTIGILKARKYVTAEGGILCITDIGKLTAHVLEKYFPEIVSVKYTSDMESKLDNVEDGNESRIQLLSDFYYPFMEQLQNAYVKMYPEEGKPVERKCPLCGGELLYKEGKNGQFIGCSNYPKCKYVEKEKPVVLEETCPHCGKNLVERKTKKGKTIICCPDYPRCKYVKPELINPNSQRKCPDCEDGYLVKKKGKYGYFYGCTNYPKCKHMEKYKWKKKKGK